ncbi:3990_t:CDS:2, partial [Cetraspora pellucida]
HNIQVWHTPAKEFDESCLVPTVGHSPGLMFWDSPDLPTSIENLEIKVKAAWYSILSKCYRKLSNSMIRRVKAYYGAD